MWRLPRRPTALAPEGHDMSISSEEFARFAEAERQLCDEAAPLLATIIRAIEVRTGLCVAEVRVTVDPANRSTDAPSVSETLRTRCSPRCCADSASRSSTSRDRCSPSTRIAFSDQMSGSVGVMALQAIGHLVA